MNLKTQFLTFFIIIFSSNQLFAQNLFSNGDFENYTTCPTALGQVNNVIGIESCTVTPDYYNASCGFLTNSPGAEGAYCSMNAQANIPSGDGFIGFFGGMFNNTSYQFESFILTLDQQTIAGQSYEIDFEMFTVDRPFGPCYKKLVGNCMDFGFLFFNSSNPVTCLTNPFYPIASPPYPAPSVAINCSAISVGSWGHQSMTYTADGVYDRVLVYFYPNANSGTAACSGKTGHFYMDNLCIKPAGGTCSTCNYTIDAGSDQSVCQGATVTLNGFSSGGVQSHTWTSSGDGTFDTNTQIHAVYTPGQNDIVNGSVTLTLTSDAPATPCTQVADELILTIIPNTVPVIDEITPLCSTSPNITLSATPAGGTWSGTGIVNSSSGEFSPAQAGAGTWEITYTTGTCGGSDVTQIEVHQEYTLNAGADTSICANQLFTCAATETGNPAVSWSASGDGSFDNPALLNATYTPGQNDLVNGTVLLTISTTVSGSACPQVSDQFTLTIDPETTAVLTVPTEICETSDPVLLQSDTPGGTWTGTGIVDSQQGLFAPAISGPGLWTINYTLIGVSCFTQASAVIHVDGQKNAGFHYADEEYCLPGSNPVPVITGDQGGVFSMDNNGNIDPSTGEVVLYNTPTGTYIIRYAFDGECQASATDTIEICGEYDVQIPNVFTPNNDLVNDVFQLQFTGVKKMSCTILNRWGNVVFSSDFHHLELMSELIIWDGITANNKKAADGVYFYRIVATDLNDLPHNYEGFLTLIR